MSLSASDPTSFEAVQAPFPGWRRVSIGGRHAERFLHSQLTSDVASLAGGESQLSALLDASGRLQAFMFLRRLRESFEILVPDGAAPALVDGLESRIIADDVRIEEQPGGDMLIALGPAAVQWAAERDVAEHFPVEAFGGRGFVAWRSEELPFTEIPSDELEALRVVSGIPRWGVEAAAGVLVNETTLVDSAVSFNKGCFLGQETVAKVASGRGAASYPMLLEPNVDPRDPASLVGRSFAVGTRKKGGEIHSWARWQDRVVLQASLHRELRVVGGEVECRFDDGTIVVASIRALPLIVTPSLRRQANALYHRAVELFAADHENEAVTLLERAIAVDPGHADAYESLGVVLGRHGRYPEAISLMQRLLEVDPNSVMAHTNMSVYYNQLGDIEAAEREAQHAAVKTVELQQRERDSADAERRRRQQTAEDQQRREEMFRQVLELDADDALANFGMGELCVETGRFEDAVIHLEAAIAADHDYSAAYLALGRAREGMCDPAAARRIYASGIEVAARRGDMMTANKMQERLAMLSNES